MSRLSGEIITQSFAANDYSTAAWDGSINPTNVVPYLSTSSDEAPSIPWREDWNINDLFIYIGSFFADDSGRTNISSFHAPPTIEVIKDSGIFFYFSAISNSSYTLNNDWVIKVLRVPAGAI